MNNEKLREVIEYLFNHSHNPFTNCDYFPEKDPDIMEEVEKLTKAENVNQ